jgi:hypothetical protein
MKVLKTMLFLSGTGKAVMFKADTIEYENKFWIVPTWLEAPSEGWKTPERIVCLNSLPHQKSSFGDADFLVNNPIPKDILYGQIPTQLKDKYVVIMHPDIKVLIQKGIH